MAYLDNNGLSHLWSKIVNLFNKRIEVSETAPTEEENKIWLQPITTNAGAVDYIVEQGVSGIWTYRKWNSGIAECWGTNNYACESMGTGLERVYGVSTAISLPSSIFSETPISISGCIDWSYSEIITFSPSTKDKFNCRIYQLSENGQNIRNYHIGCYVIGKWK